MILEFNTNMKQVYISIFPQVLYQTIIKHKPNIA